MEPSTLTELCFDQSPVITGLETILGPDLPTTGTIAGPGLAAVILSHIWGIELIPERFDHYVDSLDEPVGPTTPIRYSRPGFSEEDDFSSAQNGFSILASELRGRVIRHLIQRCRPGFGKERVLHILYALDLNAFGIGFDCYSKRLVMTDAFTEFTLTRQLRIQSPVSAESLLSLVKYREIFGCYADISEEFNLLIGFRSYCIGRGEEWAYDNTVCAQAKVIYDRHRNELAKFSQLVELDDPVIPGFEELMDIRSRLEFPLDIIQDQFGPITQLISSSVHQLDSYAFSIFYDRCIRKSISRTQLKRFLLALKYPATAYMVLGSSHKPVQGSWHG